MDEKRLFLFCGRRTDRIKALYWSGDGYILLYKRLSNGYFQWPRSEEELQLMDRQRFRWLMEGLDCVQRRSIRWAMCKFKKFWGHRQRAERWLNEIKKREPDMFAHWALSRE